MKGRKGSQRTLWCIWVGKNGNKEWAALQMDGKVVSHSIMQHMLLRGSHEGSTV